MTKAIQKAFLTLAALILAGAAAWHGPAVATRLGLAELSLVAGLISGFGLLTALEAIYDRLGFDSEHVKPDRHEGPAPDPISDKT